MKKMHVLAVAAALASAQLEAVTVGPDWCVAYPVGVPDDLGQTLKIAAEEVADDINEATGLELKAVPESEAKAPAIWIGAEAAKKAGLDLSGMAWYDNAIAEKGGSVYLFGNDMPSKYVDPEKKGQTFWFTCVVPSVKAATRFLENYAGVRFLMPGEVGKEIPRRKEVSVPDGTLSKEHPAMIYGSGRGPIDKGLIYQVANGIWGRGPFHTYGGHSSHHACPSEKYYRDHPEYFALRNGKRFLASKPIYQPLCISNPAVEELMVNELKRQFDMGADVCQLSQHDSMHVFCECENCRDLFGTGNDWGEKFWLFHCKIAKRILKERPGKVVQILSYHITQEPPKTFKVFPPNVMVEMCRYDETAFRLWKAYTVPQEFTVYFYHGPFLMPGLVARHSFAHLATLAKRFRDNNVRGLYRCDRIGDLWGTEGPAYYVFNKLLLDGSLNVKALVVDYCRSAFGPAAGVMLRFYETQDARARMFDKIADPYPYDSAAGLDEYVNARPKNALDLHGYMFSPDTVAQMEEALSQAEKTAGLSTKQKKRLELVRLEFNYAKNMGAISTLYAAYKLRPTKESFAPLKDELDRRDALLERIYRGDRVPKLLKGWPEVRPFGGCKLETIKQNGRISATIMAPLTWPKKFPDGMLPGAGVKSAEAARVAAPPAFDGFSDKDGWRSLGGKMMEQASATARFKALYDDAGLYLLVESDLVDDAAPNGCIDIMVAPGPTRDVNYHLQYDIGKASRFDAATGLVTEPLDPAYGRPDPTWEGRGWKIDSRREGVRQLSIVTLPYSDFGVVAPKPGDSWFLNVGCIGRPRKKGAAKIEMLWSPLQYRRMDAKDAMGRLTFK